MTSGEDEQQPEFAGARVMLRLLFAVLAVSAVASVAAGYFLH